MDLAAAFAVDGMGIGDATAVALFPNQTQCVVCRIALSCWGSGSSQRFPNK
jgi:hypothetical protein